MVIKDLKIASHRLVLAAVLLLNLVRLCPPFEPAVVLLVVAWFSDFVGDLHEPKSEVFFDAHMEALGGLHRAWGAFSTKVRSPVAIVDLGGATVQKLGRYGFFSCTY